jgi:hypothetical protein
MTRFIAHTLLYIEELAGPGHPGLPAVRDRAHDLDSGAPPTGDHGPPAPRAFHHGVKGPSYSPARGCVAPARRYVYHALRDHDRDHDHDPNRVRFVVDLALVLGPGPVLGLGLCRVLDHDAHDVCRHSGVQVSSTCDATAMEVEVEEMEMPVMAGHHSSMLSRFGSSRPCERRFHFWVQSRPHRRLSLEECARCVGSRTNRPGRPVPAARERAAPCASGPCCVRACRR